MPFKEAVKIEYRVCLSRFALPRGVCVPSLSSDVPFSFLSFYNFGDFSPSTELLHVSVAIWRTNQGSLRGQGPVTARFGSLFGAVSVWHALLQFVPRRLDVILFQLFVVLVFRLGDVSLGDVVLLLLVVLLLVPALRRTKTKNPGGQGAKTPV